MTIKTHETAQQRLDPIDRHRLDLELAIEAAHQAFADRRREHLAARRQLAVATEPTDLDQLAATVDQARIAWVAAWNGYHMTNLRLDAYLAHRTES